MAGSICCLYMAGFITEICQLWHRRLLNTKPFVADRFSFFPNWI